MLTEEQIKGIYSELNYKTSRSGGKGGQNVNKVESKVEIEFDVSQSSYLSESLKEKILQSKNILTSEGLIKITAAKHRSQLENKEEARKKLIDLINRITRPVKKRTATKPTRSSKRRKAESKKKLSEKKQNRRKVD